MNWESAAERLMGILKWVWYFVYVQFLFAIGTLAGLVVGGLFPSLYASILISRELMGPDADYFATRRYLKVYKAIFWKSLEIGYVSTFIFAVCFSNIVFFSQLAEKVWWAALLKMVWFVATFIVMTTLALVSPTYVDYKLTLRQLPRLFLVGLSDFRSILLTLFGAACLGIGIVYFTGVFFYIVLGAFIFMIAAANRSFEGRRIDFGSAALILNPGDGALTRSIP